MYEHFFILSIFKFYICMYIYGKFQKLFMLVDISNFPETQRGVGVLQKEALGPTTRVQAVLADRRGHEAGEPGYPGLSHRSQHSVSVRRKNVRLQQDLRIDRDTSVHAVGHGYVRQSQRTIHRDSEDRVSLIAVDFSLISF